MTRFREDAQSDVYIYNGAVDRSGFQKLAAAADFEGRCARATLFLTTLGGDPHAAYRIARLLDQTYEVLRVVVAGPCKSAGTLIVVGAGELAMGILGELGPLDVQLTRPDEVIPISSGLDTIKAYATLDSYIFDSFEHYMLTLVAKSSGSISTKLASEIACQLATGLVTPIASQIDPLRLAEVSRALAIAEAYGERLSAKKCNVKTDTVSRLIETYPAHGFVIDAEEARELFRRVDNLTPLEAEMCAELDLGSLRTADGNFVISTSFIMGEGGSDETEAEGASSGDATTHEAGDERPSARNAEKRTRGSRQVSGKQSAVEDGTPQD